MRSIPLLALVLLVGCGSTDVIVEGDPPTTPYDGPMHVQQSFADHADVMKRSGAAGLALECDSEPENGGGGDYDSGLASVQDGPGEAYSNWLEEDAFSGLPDKGFRVERDDGDRVLLSYDVQGRTKVAVIAADDVRDFNDDVGWGVESWAHCNAAELPAAYTDEAGIQVWEDAEGNRVSTNVVTSHQGAEHCDWQDIRFLTLGPPSEMQQYVRDTAGEFDNLLGTYSDQAPLPEEASDSGYRYDGRALWLVPDQTVAYLVSEADPTDVERWPGSREPILCA